ncbi:MAG: MASE1 domain-containing protein [Prochlorothrix sp.]
MNNRPIWGRRWSRVLISFGLAFLYALTAAWSRTFAATPQNVTPIWPPDGLAAAAALLTGPWIGPGIFLGSFLANIGAFFDGSTGASSLLSLITVTVIALGTTLGTLVGSWSFKRKVDSVYPFQQVKSTLFFLLYVTLLGPVFNATFGVTALTFGQHISWELYLPVWFTWWISNVAGILILTPALLSWGGLVETIRNPDTSPIQFRKPFTPRHSLELGILLAIVTAVSVVSFWYPVPLEYVLMPCLVWTAFRFSELELTSLIVLISALAVLGTVQGLGSFGNKDVNYPLTALQTFIGVIIVTTLIFNAVINENVTAFNRMKRSQELLLLKSQELEESALSLERQNQELAIAKRAAESANHAKSQFIANMSHDLRTPLNGILGITQVFQLEADLTTQQQDNINIIHQSGSHLLMLINDILDISKIEAGKLSLEPQPLNLATFLASICDLMRSTALDKQLHFVCFLSEAVNVTVEADEKRLRQVLLNLLGNAIKFTDSGSITFTVEQISPQAANSLYLPNPQPANSLNLPSPQPLNSQHPQPPNSPNSPPANSQHPHLSTLTALSSLPSDLPLPSLNSAQSDPYCRFRFQIEDTGIGIAADSLDRVFMAFEQVGDQAFKTQGTGLGLSISQSLVQMMGGQIQVQSELGRGSLFYFDLELPIKGCFLPDPNQSSSLMTLVDPHLAQKLPFKILVAEDGLVNRKVADALFKKLGYRVDMVTNGQEVLQSLESQDYDLIFMDIQMPKLDGVATTQAVLQRYGNSPQCPYIIAMTANAMDSDRSQYLNLGMKDHLPKPVKITAIMEAIQRAYSYRLQQGFSFESVKA